MTADEAQAQISEIRITQVRLREELIELVTASLAGGPIPKRASELFTEELRLETEVDNLRQYLPDDATDQA